jgi:DHA1 family multidrug resistance protein-like MFS transporter
MSVSLILLCISLFTWGVGEGLFFVFQPIYLAQLGANTMTIASVYSAFGAAMMVAHIPAGYLADRLGRKPLLIAAWTSGMLATWVMAFSRTLPVFIVGMLMYGLTAFVSSPLNSYVTTERGKLTPARAMTFMSAAFNLGAVIGPLTGGWIGEQVGLRTVYFIAAVLFMVSTAILFFLRSQPRDNHDPDDPAPSLLTNTRFIGFLGIIFLVMFATYLPQPLTARFLENERNLSLSSIGLLGSVNGLGNAVFNLFLGQFSSRFGLVMVQVCVAAFALFIWRGTGLGWYVVGYFILGGQRTARAFFFSTVRSLIHPAQMGLAYGVSETFNSLAIVLAPLLAGLLYTRNPEWVYIVCLGLLGIVILITIAFTPRQSGKEPVAVNPSLDL